MIISCEKCNKKFEISDDLIPSKGRILQCGSCMHKWHFVPIDEDQPVLKIKESNDTNEDSKEQTIQKKDTFKQTDVKKDKLRGLTYDHILEYLKGTKKEERLEKYKVLLKFRNIPFEADLFTWHNDDII